MLSEYHWGPPLVALKVSIFHVESFSWYTVLKCVGFVPSFYKVWCLLSKTGLVVELSIFIVEKTPVRGRPLMRKKIMIWGARRKNRKWIYFFRGNAFFPGEGPPISSGPPPPRSLMAVPLGQRKRKRGKLWIFEIQIACSGIPIL